MLVVDDSLTVRKRVVEALSTDPDLEVIGEAENGRRGIELCQALRPDVVTMDMMMPVATGLAATEQIMARCPTPILIVSASANRTEGLCTFDALAAGAVDVLDKPTAGEPSAVWARKLCDSVKMTARIRVIRHPRARLAQPSRASPSAIAAHPVPSRAPSSISAPPSGIVTGPRVPPRVVVIGASTGGPVAVARVLRDLPARYPIPILLVIHVSTLFAASLADWLAQQCSLPVRLAAPSDRLPPIGEPGVIMAPPDRHLLVQAEHLHLEHGPERHSCRPSVDVLFESAARELGPRVLGCLLTGMGVDGAAGLHAIQLSGGDTIAQDEATSKIWGMPGAAVKLGAAARVLPIEQIAPALARAAERACASLAGGVR
ncbi:Chemotaxis response regulator protein-glutamate methylesterase CheB [Minicystis rosea]|nr:Chemotaxis response regulator protein-glutamate methylesterase CheB [Minicystis rosea]